MTASITNGLAIPTTNGFLTPSSSLNGTNLTGTLTNSTTGNAATASGGWPPYPTTNGVAFTNGTYLGMTVGNATTAGTATNLAVPTGSNAFWTAPWGSPTNSGSMYSPLDSDATAFARIGTNYMTSLAWICHFPGTVNNFGTNTITLAGNVSIYNYGALMLVDCSFTGDEQEMFVVGMITNGALLPANFTIYGGSLSNLANARIFSLCNVATGITNFITLKNLVLSDNTDGFFGVTTNNFIDLEGCYFYSAAGDCLQFNGGANGLIRNCYSSCGQVSGLDIGGGVWEIDNSQFIVPANEQGCPNAISIFNVSTHVGKYNTIISFNGVTAVNNDTPSGVLYIGPASSYGTNFVTFSSMPCPAANMSINPTAVVTWPDWIGSGGGLININTTYTTNTLYTISGSSVAALTALGIIVVTNNVVTTRTP